jgi:hypothetical protein
MSSIIAVGSIGWFGSPQFITGVPPPPDAPPLPEAPPLPDAPPPPKPVTAPGAGDELQPQSENRAANTKRPGLRFIERLLA